jgi:protein SCO1/2
VIRRAALVGSLVVAIVAVSTRGISADTRYPVTGMVLTVDRARHAFTASIDAIPGFMNAMAMPFTVQDDAELAALAPGAVVEFTLVVGTSASHAERVHVKRYESVEQDPLAARRLSLVTQIASGTLVNPVAVGAAVPNFTLIDQQRRRVTLSQFRGKVVAINFMYTTCQLPDYCLRMVNHFGVLQKRLASRLDRDLIFLTITFDPVRDTPDVLTHYAAQWAPISASWHFLTGPEPDIRRVLGTFGVSAFPDEGLMDHSLHTIVIRRDGTLAANVEGNQYSSDQLADLLAAVLQ